MRASEQDRPDVKEQREKWQELQKNLDPEKLVFLDETSTNTKMTRLYGWGSLSERLVCPAPYGHWKTTTFIAGLRHDKLTAPLVIDGTMNGGLFVEYIRQQLAPTLAVGDYVIMDNLPCHKVKGVREAIEEKGAILLYLPPYSPDLNPIEQFFSKLKSLLRKAAARTVDELESAIVQIIDSLKQIECYNFFVNSGY